MGKPLYQALVSLDGAKRAVYSNRFGAFTFIGVIEGQARNLVIKHASGLSNSQQINLEEDIDLGNIVLVWKSYSPTT
jgi:hypothetical protein